MLPVNTGEPSSETPCPGPLICLCVARLYRWCGIGDETQMGMGGAVGGVDRDDLPQIVADLVLDRGENLEIWIRPEQTGFGYSVEWTTTEYVPVNVFAVGDRYLLKQYFDDDDVFNALRPYYNDDKYRFEIPAAAFNEVRTILEKHFYEPVVIRDLEPFCVVYPKYTDHPTILFKAAILQRSHHDNHIFLLKDQRSVEQAVNQGATALTDAGIENPFS